MLCDPQASYLISVSLSFLYTNKAKRSKIIAQILLSAKPRSKCFTFISSINYHTNFLGGTITILFMDEGVKAQRG